MHPYSDGSAIYEFGVAVVLLTLAFGVIRAFSLEWIDRPIRRLAVALRSTGIFSSTISLSAEAYRLDLLRIVIGAMAFWHYLPELTSTISVNPTSAFWFGFAVVTSACVTVGFMTPVAALLLMLTLNTLIVNITASISIGALVIAMCMLPMVVAPAGYTLSIDALLLRRWSMMRRLYTFWGAPTVDRFQIGRFLALLAYCAISLYSALMHVQSETWLQGLSTGIILLFPTSNVLHHEVVGKIYEAVPVIYILFSRVSTWGMLFWQIFLLPLALIQFTRPVVIIWGIVFFTFSTFILWIKTLGIYEYVLFAIIFWSRAGIDGRGRNIVLRRLLRISRDILGLLNSRKSQHFSPSAPARISHRKTPVFAASMLTFSVLLVAFSLRLPYVNSSLPTLATVSKSVFGSAPQAIGIGRIDVFNEGDLAIYRSKVDPGFFTTSGERLPRGFPDLPEWMHGNLTQDLRVAIFDEEPAYCNEAFGDRLARYYSETLLQDDPFRESLIVVTFLESTHPSIDDFRNFRYAPITWEKSCTTVASISDPELREVTYYPDTDGQ